MKINRKIIIILLIGIVFFAFGTEIYAAINEDYFNQTVSGMKVVDASLNKKMEDSVLLEVITFLVYAVGSLIEWILGNVFKMITGTNIFPWADAIVFNAIPLLDINIFNPSNASLVAIIKEFIQSAYWTVFSLALSFFGIAIMVTAIKSVLSTIASDKATYKQAIVKWIMGFVMLWGIHFFLSFALFLNEQLVIVASDMASKAMENAAFELDALMNDNVAAEDRLLAFFEAMGVNKQNVLTIAGEIMMIAGALLIVLMVVGVIAVGFKAIVVTAILIIAGGVLVYSFRYN